MCWNDEHQKAQKTLANGGLLLSAEPFARDEKVMVKFEDGMEWEVPHLVPYDLVKLLKGGVPLPKLASVDQEQAKPKAKAAAKNKVAKPVPDYEYDIIRCRYSSQGPKHPPLIKVERREDRNDVGSRWRQRLQILVKGQI